MGFKTLFITVLLINTFAFLTIRLRPVLFKTKLFKPMIWNFKLSLLPMIILLVTLSLVGVIITVANTYEIFWMFNLAIPVLLVGVVLWLLMLPNSGYLITELNMTHRTNDADIVPIWYDIVSVSSFALSGIINTIANITIIQMLGLVLLDPDALTQKNRMMLLISGIIINMLVAIGVYLGRQIRFNSWDLLHPLSFIKKLGKHFNSKEVYKEFILFVSMHTIFFMIMYYALGVTNIFNFI